MVGALGLYFQLHVLNYVIPLVPGVVSSLMVEPRLTSIVITWRPPQDPNGVIIAYEVTYRVNDSNPTTINTTDISTTRILELALNTRVSGISVRAYTSIGPGNVTTHPDVSTPQQPTLRESDTLLTIRQLYSQAYNLLAVVMRVLVEPLSETSVNVSWESVTFPGIVFYIVYYRPSETMRRQSEQSVTVPSSESSVMIEDLMTNVEYQFQVAATAELEGVIYLGERSRSAQVLVALPTPPGTILPSNSTTPVSCNKTAVALCSYFQSCDQKFGQHYDFSAGTTCVSTRDLSIAVVLTFLLSITLYTAILLVGCGVLYAHNSNKKK